LDNLVSVPDEKIPSPEGRRWREAPDEGINTGSKNLSPAAHQMMGGFLSNLVSCGLQFVFFQSGDYSGTP